MVDERIWHYCCCAAVSPAPCSWSAVRRTPPARKSFIAGSAGAPAINACDLNLTEAAALLRRADLFVGPSSGPLNLAAAGGTDAFGLFGSTPVLTYSKFIHPIVPPGGPSPDGMRRILSAQVLAAIEPHLSREKSQT